MIKTVTKVDASITDTPRKPKGKITHEVDNDNQPKRYYPPSVDADANWIKKAGKTRYGFKKHIITDDEGLAVDVKTTKASTHDAQVLEDLTSCLVYFAMVPACLYFKGQIDSQCCWVEIFKSYQVIVKWCLTEFCNSLNKLTVF